MGVIVHSNIQSIFNKVIRYLSRWRAYLVLILTFVIASIFTPYFFNYYNLASVLSGATIIGVIGCGMTVAIIVADLDLSVGAVAGFSAVLMGSLLMWGVPLPLAIIIGLITSLIIGFISGIITVKIGINPIIATLGMLFLVNGLELLISGENVIRVDNPGLFFLGTTNIVGFPILFIILIGIFLTYYFIAHFTKYGRFLYSTGTNLQAAKLSGVEVDLVKISGFMLSALTAAIGGIFILARDSSAQVLAGNPYLLRSAAAYFLGNALFDSEKPLFKGTVVGALLISVIRNALTLSRVSVEIIRILEGGILIIAVALTIYFGGQRINK